MVAQENESLYESISKLEEELVKKDDEINKKENKNSILMEQVDRLKRTVKYKKRKIRRVKNKIDKYLEQNQPATRKDLGVYIFQQNHISFPLACFYFPFNFTTTQNIFDKLLICLESLFSIF